MRQQLQSLGPDDLDGAWAAYKSHPTRELKHRLFTYFFKEVQHIARRGIVALRSLNRPVDEDDLIAEGSFGLLRAIDTYDPARGTKFITYCKLPIKGAMIDYLRKIDWVPRLTRSRQKRACEATYLLRAILGRAPTDQEMATEMRLSPANYQRAKADCWPPEVLSTSDRLKSKRPTSASQSYGNNGIEGIAALIDSHNVDPADGAALKEIVPIIRKELTRQHSQIVLDYYFHHKTMRQIGDGLGLSESRVSQILQILLLKLRKRFEAFASGE